MQALYALKRYDEVLAALQDIPAYLTDYMLDHKEFQIMESLKDWKKRILHAKASLPSHELQKKKNKMDEPLLQKEFDSMKAKIDELYESGSYDEALFVLENTPRNLEDYILDHPKVMQNIKSLKKKLLDDKELRGGKRVVPRIDENVKNEIQHLKDKADEAFVQGEYDYALALIQETISRFDDDILDRPKIVARFSHLRDIILQAKSESSPEALAKVKSSDSVESRGVTKQIDKFNELIKLEKYNEALNLNKRIVSDFENYLSSHPEVAKILKD